ncbi:MAG: phosphate/phosphite/phosphonate ABC transporter substrate-binding protein [Hyphomicrobiales bacterium]|nr:phosphate/phosphite/phosphonate ABC transporter substrate-binding protein [Hyphomicrobiales bacterium]
MAVALSMGGMVGSAADWRDGFDGLRVGVPLAPNASYEIAILEPFRAYLQGATGVPVEIVAVGGYPELIDAQVSGQVNYGIYSATSFATAVETCDCVEAVAAPVAANGALGFYSVLLARKGSGIRTLAEAEGKSLALTGAGSVAGNLIPMQALAAEGIVPRQYFTRIVVEADPRAAIMALLAREVDVAVGWSSFTGTTLTGYDFGVLTRMVADGELNMGQVRIIWRSPLIPFGPHAISADLPPELKQAIARAMTAIAVSAPEALDAVDSYGFGGGGFTTPDSSLYEIVMDLVRPEDGSSQ